MWGRGRASRRWARHVRRGSKSHWGADRTWGPRRERSRRWGALLGWWWSRRGAVARWRGTRREGTHGGLTKLTREHDWGRGAVSTVGGTRERWGEALPRRRWAWRPQWSWGTRRGTSRRALHATSGSPVPVSTRREAIEIHIH